MKNLAIIPARSGSKGLKDKNIKNLNGIPLISYSIKCALESKIFDEVMVSTDSEEYASIAKKYGANVPFLRAPKTSGDNASSWDVVIEVLEKYRKIGIFFETVCLLQPTSPLRLSTDIIGGYNLLTSKCGDSVTSVCEVDHSPLWTMNLPEDLSLNEFNKMCDNRPRQKLGTFYRLNGAIYIRKIEYSDLGIEIKNDNDYALIMDRNRSVDIDTGDDFELAEFYLGKM